MLEFLKNFLIQPAVALVGFLFCWFSIFFISMFKDKRDYNE